MGKRGARTRTVVLLILLIAGGGISLVGQRSSQSPEARLGAAMHQADVEGDLDAAIAIFKEVAADARASRAIVAAALLGLAKAYEKRGDGEAQTIYARLDREFGDQPAAIDQAARRQPRPRQAAVRTWSGPGVDGSGSLSPDGRYLTFADWGTGDLAVRDLVTDTTRRLTNSGGWTASGDYTEASTLSPDGQSVAYDWWNSAEQRGELRVRTLAGRAPPRVVLSSAVDSVRPLAWTPDGRVVVHRQSLERVNRLGVVTLRDGVYKDLVTLDWRWPRRASLSPDGRHLAYAVPAGANGSPRDVFLLQLSDGSPITAVSGAPDDYDPVWSPDGSRLLFLSMRTGSPSVWAVGIRNGRPAGEPVSVKADLGTVTLLGMTRDNALFYLVAGSARSDVYVAPLDGGRLVKPGAPVTDTFVSTNQGPAWSPDGESLAFYSLRERPVLVTRSMTTGVEREVALPSSLASPFRSGPRWFPDGRSVLVLSRQDANFVFLRVYLDTGQTEPLHTVTTRLSSFTLSPDGRTIFWAVQQGQLMKYDLVERRATELAAGETFITVAISPDGRQLAYVKSTMSLQNAAIIEVMAATGGPAREIHRDTQAGGSRYNTLAWSPDSTSLIFVDEVNRFWRLPIEGPPQPLPGTIGRGKVKAPAIHPSGGRLAFGLSHDANNELWRLDHVLPTR